MTFQSALQLCIFRLFLLMNADLVLCVGSMRPSIKKADKLFDAKKWSGAIDMYEKCIAGGLVISAEQKSDVYFSLGFACHDLYDSGAEGRNANADKAVEWYSKVIALGQYNETRGLAFRNRGMIETKQRKYALALADYNQAVSIYIQDRESSTAADAAATRFERSFVYRGLGLHDLELSDLQQSISFLTNPKSPKMYRSAQTTD